MTSALPRWENWARTESAAPSKVVTPGSVDELRTVVADAAEAGLTVKPIGAGHSFSGIGVPGGVQVRLDRLRGLVGSDPATDRVTLAAGTHLHEIPALLAPLGLAMPNLGDIDRQTISGATSTGTHGTGAKFGGISTQIVGATVIDGRGEIVRVEADDSDLSAVALGLGALGVLVDVTLQCVPAFHLEAVETPGKFDETLAGWDESLASTDHYEFYWFPHTDCCSIKSNTRLPATAARSGPSKVRRYIDDELLSNKLFGALCAIGRRLPATVPTINQLSGRALSGRTIVDSSTDVFVSSRTVRFREMEYAIPVEAIPDALREVRAMIDRRGYRVSFPVEVRAAAADDLMLSTAAGRDSGYIAVHRYFKDDPADSDAYFADVEQIMTAHAGRPHWGKMHTRDAEYLRTVYPRFDEFLAVRDRYDPDRVFANDYLRRVLGD
ncbi:putative FAD-linked oxidase [Gordonia araii NBRC 100433]|uniref:Putative FAD-linked oxidase n=2 Tax=Gordonia araii TaxID=263909 RepID=G7H3G1_9ACTN|nr:D-arabinono-1,4-lactone oxidase [Gordonia araii]GAB10386.1 putative FAD-linked oxidase [Gordonia araii NBRC 100433]